MHAVSKKVAAIWRKLFKTLDQQGSMKKWMVQVPLAPFLRSRQQGRCVTIQTDATCIPEQVPA
jgi:hypothetical protein